MADDGASVGGDSYSETTDADTEENVEEEESTKKNYITGFFRKRAKAFVKNFVNYGPPYVKDPFINSLANECSKPVINHLELNRLLNCRYDPNIPDKEDLYYYPMHWCGRNAHLAAMKMIRRAGALFNVTNELGSTPLDLCVMIKHPPDKRAEQINTLNYMLENGADPNNRDKGGMSAIDHAAANQDEEIILILLDYGAKVLRENYTLVAKRPHILKNVRYLILKLFFYLILYYQ